MREAEQPKDMVVSVHVLPPSRSPPIDDRAHSSAQTNLAAPALGEDE
jgi:hypothetical protein